MLIVCFENFLFDRVFLIMFKWLSWVCVLVGVVFGCEGDLGDCFDEVIRLVELLIIVVEVDINFG